MTLTSRIVLALAGAALGARVLPGARSKPLRLVFALVVVALGVEMVASGIAGRV